MGKSRLKSATSLVMCLVACNVMAQPLSCGFQQAFDRPDQGGAGTIHVYESKLEPKIGGVKALAYVSSLKVNTDGTRISYKVDDPKAQHGAINDIRNALRSGRTIDEFEAAAAAKWQPLDKTWQILNPQVLEKDTKKTKSGAPCVDQNNYMISMTADVSVAGGYGRQGDCDATKWIDALSVQAIVLPSPENKVPTQFDTRGATTRSVAVVMTLDGARRISYGIVGDKGPTQKLGEASVAMNRKLNGLPDGENPTSDADAVKRFQAPNSIVLLFPAKANRLPYPVTAATVEKFAMARFHAWGGEARLNACLGEMPEAH